MQACTQPITFASAERFGNVVNYVGWDAVISIVPILLVVGVLLAGLTSLLTLQRYLRV